MKPVLPCQKKDFTCPIYIVSHLQLDGNPFDIFIKFIEKRTYKNKYFMATQISLLFRCNISEKKGK